MTLGPVMLDVIGPELLPEDRHRLSHPLVGGVILFTRNYLSPDQLKRLTTAIHAVKTPPLLIAVDHEGGRVQRFREGFTRLPPMRELGRLWDEDPRFARDLARQAGYVLAAELRAHGVDFSFAPVLDVDFGASGVIGDRAFHRDPQAISELAQALQSGMREAGMASVGKHYPGHGHVKADSHLEVPVDEREYVDIELTDLEPYRRMSDRGMTAVMPAHVIYPRVDSKAAGFSPVWLKEILRGRLGFEGVIFSDDLSMEGASTEGDIVERANAALNAGCDMVLVCNNPAAADEVLERLQWTMPPASVARLARMRGGPQPVDMAHLQSSARYHDALAGVKRIYAGQSELALGPDPTIPHG